MDWLWWLALGALIGWLVEWVIDWWYWRRRMAALEAELAASRTAQAPLSGLRVERDRLQADVRAAQAERERTNAALRDCGVRSGQLEQHVDVLQKRVAELEPLSGQLARLRAENTRLREDLAAASAAPSELPFSGAVAPTLTLRDVEPAPEEAVAALSLGTAPDRHDPLVDINGIGPVYERRLVSAGVLTFAQLAEMDPETVRAIIKPESWQNIDPEAWLAEAKIFAGQVRDGTYRRGGA